MTSFRKTSFTDTFRDSIIHKLSSVATIPGPNSSNSTWAAAAKTTPTPFRAEPTSQPSQRPERGIAHNPDGHRIDPSLPPVPQELILSFKEQKYCNFFHRRRRCPYRKRDFRHGDRLQGQELIALRHVVRMGPCTSGLACVDEACVSAHRCPKGPNCGNLICFSSPERHYIDTQIVTT